MSDAASQTGRKPCETIAVVRSPFKEKFGIPRQAGLAEAARGWVDMLPPYDDPVMFAGLEKFSHIWLSFVFHAAESDGWRRRVRPPRLGGNQRVGVFATRSPFRPNHLGLSAVELLAIESDRGIRLRVGGLDLLDGTPIVDIKPYLPYADARPDARGGFADERPKPALSVKFAESVARSLARREDGEGLRTLIAQALALDPRPAYRAATESQREYGMAVADVDVRWRVNAGLVEVLELRLTR